MKFLFIPVCALVVMMAPCVLHAADGPSANSADKLFGMVLLNEPLDDAVVQAYEASGSTAAFVRADWAKIEPSNPGGAGSRYDFTSFDSQPFARSAKTRICIVSFATPWLSDVKNARRALELQEEYAAELAKHACGMGIRHFWLPAQSYAGHHLSAYVHDLKALNKAAKQAGKDVIVMAGPASSTPEEIDTFYSSGGKGHFDVLVINAGAPDPGQGIGVLSTMSALGAMSRNGDSGKPVFVMAEPKADFRSAIDNTYRNLVTDREVLPPGAVLGAAVAAKADTALLKDAPTPVPAHSLECSIEAGSPVLNYIAGKAYPMSLRFSNKTRSTIRLDKFAVDFPDAGAVKIEVSSDGDPPKEVAAGAEVTASYNVKFSEDCIGRAWMVRGNLDYTVDGSAHRADCYYPAVVTPELEVNLLPQRLVIGPGMEAKTMGLSVINHNDKLYSGDVVLSPYRGVKLSTTRRKIVVDPFGLDAFVFKVEREASTLPGRYAIMVDVGGKTKDWIAVDVTLGIKRSPGEIRVDGDLKDWKDTDWVSVAKTEGGKSVGVGRASFAYDENNLYAAFETDDSGLAIGSVRLAFDPYADGSRTASGGYRDDDYEFEFVQGDKPKVSKSKGSQPRVSLTPEAVSFAVSSEAGSSVCEIALPWRELSPLSAAHKAHFTLAALITRGTDVGDEHAAWGGGLVPKVDPRAFAPAVLVK